VLAPRLGAFTPFRRARADQITLHVREAAKNGNHQPAGAGAAVGPRLGQGSELRLGVHDLLDDGEQVERAARQPVNARHRHLVTGADGFQQLQKLAPVGPCARHLLAEDRLAAVRARKS
jgi:hypothetical protein